MFGIGHFAGGCLSNGERSIKLDAEPFAERGCVRRGIPDALRVSINLDLTRDAVVLHVDLTARRNR